MSLLNYYAIDKVLDLGCNSVNGWEITEKRIKEIDKFFAPYLDQSRLVLIPRFNGDYISFRYCGLEILRFTKKGAYQIKITEQKGRIRGVKKAIILNSLDEIRPLLDKIKIFFTEYRINFTEVIKESKQDRYIPGFSLEHWLESIVLSDSAIGEEARKRLGMNVDLKRVVSQAPVILKPKTGRTKNRHHHVDLLSINDDGRIVVVELKKDSDYNKAIKELEEYTDWLLKNKNEFHVKRGNPQAMADEHYLPQANFDVAVDKIQAVAVVMRRPPRDGPFELKNGVKLRAVTLPEDWLSKEGTVFS